MEINKTENHVRVDGKGLLPDGREALTNARGIPPEDKGLSREEMAGLKREMEARYGAELIRASQEYISKVEKELSAPASGETAKTDDDRKESSSQDLVRLSNEVRSRMEETFWTEELEKLWMDLAGWLPKEGLDQEQLAFLELDEILRLYQQIWKILAAQGSETAGSWVDKLNQALAGALQRYTEHFLREEVTFLQRFGTSGEASRVRDSLYFHVTGRQLSPGEARRFWEQKNPGPAGMGGTGGEGLNGRKDMSGAPGDGSGSRNIGGSYRTAGSAGMEAQILRSREGAAGRSGPGAGGFPDKRAAAAYGYQADRIRSQEEKAAFLPGHRMNQADGAKASFLSGSAGVYSKNDMIFTENFCRFMNQEYAGNCAEALKNPGGEEMPQEEAGCVAAMMHMMGEVYPEYAKLSPQMGKTVRGAVQRMVDYYICQSFGQGGQPEMPKKAYQVYYYILEQIRSGKTLKRAVEEGTEFAEKLLYQMKDPETEDAAFSGGRQDLKQGWRRRISGSWNRYLETMKFARYEELDLDFLSQSPWGAGMLPSFLNGPVFWRMLSAAGVLAAAGLLFLYFQH